MNQESGTRQKGFTLIEMLVAIGVATLLFLSLSGLSAVLMRTQRRALRDVRIMDNARYAIESIARTLRTVDSSDITTPSGNDTAGARTVVVSHRGRIGGLGCPTMPCVIQYVYNPTGGTLMQRDGDGTIVPLPLIPSSLRVEDFRIFFAGRDAAGDGQQPRATVTLTVRDPSSTTTIPLTLSTTVSLRGLDIE